MTDLTSLIQGLVSQLGRAFFISGYGPVLIGMAINMYLLFSPAVTGADGPFNLFPQIEEPLLGILDGQLLTLLLVPLLLGLIVMALNTVIVKFFEGMLPGMKVLLYPFYRANVRRHQELYGALISKREERRQLLLGSSSPDPQAEYELRLSIQEEHEKAEAEETVQSLPRDPRRVTPTAFGNAWAVIEDYPWERYGMDSVLFWPRLRSIVAQKDESIIGLLDNQKVILDMLINLALVMLVLAAEGVGVAIGYGRLDMLLLVMVALLLVWGFYRSAVLSVKSMGALITQCFDFYRDDLLAAYGLEQPATLQEERPVWLRLAAFLRRGEPFYFDSLRDQQ